MTIRNRRYYVPIRSSLHISYSLISNLNLRKLSIFSDSLENENTNEFLSKIKLSLEEVRLHFKGNIVIETYRLLINEMPKLKVLWLRRNEKTCSAMNNDRVNLDVSLLEKNNSIETLNIDGSYHQSSLLIEKLPNVKRLELNGCYMKRAHWRAVSIHMKQLTFLQIETVEKYDLSNFSGLKILTVKELKINKCSDPNQYYVSYLSLFRLIKALPNLEKLEISEILLKNININQILMKIADSCKYLKILKIETMCHCDFSTLMYLSQNGKFINLIALPKNSIRLDILDVNLINDLYHMEKLTKENVLTIIES